MLSFPVTKPIVVLVGPTAIGKTALSLALAKLFSCEIISMDAMQVYRYMNIGTAKASREERDAVPHHLIDIVNPDEHYDAERFVEDACNAIDDIHSRNKIPLITGGTGLYLNALLGGLFEDGGHYPEIRKKLKSRIETEGKSVLYDELVKVDPISADRIHENDTHRILRALEIYCGTGVPWSEHLENQKKINSTKRFTSVLKVGLTCERRRLYDRIDRRCEIMLQEGLEEEVRALLAAGYSPNLKSMKSIGYRHMVSYINGIWNKETTERLLARDTRRYAKRQYTWFSKSRDIQWFDISRSEEVKECLAEWLKDFPDK